MSLATVHYLSMVGKGGRLDGFTSTGFVGDEVTLSVKSLTHLIDYTFVWGDETSDTETADSAGTVSSSHTYTEEGTYDVRVNEAVSGRQAFRYRITQAQKTGGTIELLDDVLEENTEAEFGFSGLSENADLVVVWGDGTTDDFTSDSSGESSGTHTYDSYGDYVIQVIDDEDDPEDPQNALAELEITVDHREGDLIWAVLSVIEDVANTLNGTNFAFERAYSINWGDESPVSSATTNGSGAFTANHTFADAGSYTVMVKDGTFVAATLNVTVEAAAPPSPPE